QKFVSHQYLEATIRKSHLPRHDQVEQFISYLPVYLIVLLEIPLELAALLGIRLEVVVEVADQRILRQMHLYSCLQSAASRSASAMNFADMSCPQTMLNCTASSLKTSLNAARCVFRSSRCLLRR